MDVGCAIPKQLWSLQVSPLRVTPLGSGTMLRGWIGLMILTAGCVHPLLLRSIQSPPHRSQRSWLILDHSAVPTLSIIDGNRDHISAIAKCD